MRKICIFYLQLATLGALPLKYVTNLKIKTINEGITCLNSIFANKNTSTHTPMSTYSSWWKIKHVKSDYYTGNKTKGRNPENLLI